MLAATLDGRVVVLDTRQARVVLFDPRMEGIWRACTGLFAGEIAGFVHEDFSTVDAALRELDEVGLVTSKDGRWSQAPITWI
jgi:hypothetical protein